MCQYIFYPALIIGDGVMVSSELITDEFLKTGLVLEKDAKQNLTVRAF